eukprot:gnl/Chilomastix_cuspidata/1988.p1 GENE.gnl/Chilomastix_cuspidata/1988~~gnl/Chilomastix_cuspidata/1988.p1  ORF type:complete len:879 (-),score=112.77 gnl/Chilomastix_cuspidata/1988:22-2658(-)
MIAPVSRGSSQVPQIQNAATNFSNMLSSRSSLPNGNFIVTTRIRPENPKERKNYSTPLIKTVNENVLIFDPKFSHTGARLSYKKWNGDREPQNIQLHFDRIFDEKSTQAEVFQGTLEPLIPQLLDGYNVTVMAYGPTGSGKTHTMVGDKLFGPGIIDRSIGQIFQVTSQSPDVRFSLSLSLFEIYCENVFDLLTPCAGERRPLTVREDARGNCLISGLTKTPVQSAAEALRIVSQGFSERVQSSTKANDYSSRSHAILQIHTVVTAIDTSNVTERKSAVFTLVDLAGCERAAQNTNTALQLKEGAKINQSLLALGSCLTALSAKTSKRPYVPYRNSKLTRILKNSLGGNSLTVMVATVSPSHASYDDTLSALRYAARARVIKNSLKKNSRHVARRVKDFQKKIDSLEAENASLRQRVAALEARERRLLQKIQEGDLRLNKSRSPVSPKNSSNALPQLFAISEATAHKSKPKKRRKKPQKSPSVPNLHMRLVAYANPKTPPLDAAAGALAKAASPPRPVSQRTIKSSQSTASLQDAAPTSRRRSIGRRRKSFSSLPNREPMKLLLTPETLDASKAPKSSTSPRRPNSYRRLLNRLSKISTEDQRLFGKLQQQKAEIDLLELEQKNLNDRIFRRRKNRRILESEVGTPRSHVPLFVLAEYRESRANMRVLKKLKKDFAKTNEHAENAQNALYEFFDRKMEHFNGRDAQSVLELFIQHHKLQKKHKLEEMNNIQTITMLQHESQRAQTLFNAFENMFLLVIEIFELTIIPQFDPMDVKKILHDAKTVAFMNGIHVEGLEISTPRSTKTCSSVHTYTASKLKEQHPFFSFSSHSEKDGSSQNSKVFDIFLDSHIEEPNSDTGILTSAHSSVICVNASNSSVD